MHKHTVRWREKMMKKQTDFTFDEAKEIAIRNLSILASFAESMHDQLIGKVPLQLAIVLRTIEAKVRKASEPCLSDLEIRQVWDFAQYLIQVNPELTLQLSQFWKLYDNVLKRLSSKLSGPGYALQNMIAQLRPRIEIADTLAESIVSAVKSNTSNILSPVALLLIHLVRTETIEYALRKQLKDAIETHDLQGKYDVEIICSVQGKVRKGQEWRTDVRAIRDATAHGQFKIHSSKNDWEVQFDNDEDGYNFHKRFSRKEFTKFFDLHTFLYKFQLHLLIILELLPILATHFHKRS